MKFSTTLIAFLSVVLLSCGITRTDEAVLKDYVDKNLGPMMKKQEQVMGIRHRGVPKIEYRSCLPPPPTESTYICSHAAYNTISNTITLNPTSLVFQQGRYKGQVDPFITFALHHELGHFYADKLSEENGNGSWPKAIYLTPGDDIVSEGIAEHFAHRMSETNIPDNHKIDCSTSEWPTNYWPSFPTYQAIDVYNAGYCTAEPIIEKYCDRGILFLIRNTPSMKDMLELKEYQQYALDILSKH
jgi:hypothetical protein